MAEQHNILDVTGGTVTRAIMKSLINWGLNRAQRKAPETFKALAWLHISPNASRELLYFRGAIVAVGSWIDHLSAGTNLPGWAKKGIETGMADVVGSFTNYFELNRKSITFPDDYAGIQGEEGVKTLIKEFQAFIGQELREDLPSALESIKLSRKGAATERMVNLLVRCKDPFVVWSFYQYYHKLSPEQKETLLHAAHHFDELEELVGFIEHPAEVQEMILELAKASHDMSIVPMLTRMARENWTKFNQAFEQAMGMTADEAYKLKNMSEMGLAVRRVELERKRKERAAARKSPVHVGLWLTFAVILLLTMAVMFLAPSCNKKDEKAASEKTSLGPTTTTQLTAADSWQPSAVMNSAPFGGSYHG